MERLSRQRCYVHQDSVRASRPSVVPLVRTLFKLIQAVVAVSGGVGPGVIRLVYSSESAMAVVLPLFTLALAIGMEVGIVGSWVSAVAASAVSVFALGTFALTLALLALALALAFLALPLALPQLPFGSPSGRRRRATAIDGQDPRMGVVGVTLAQSEGRDQVQIA